MLYLHGLIHYFRTSILEKKKRCLFVILKMIKPWQGEVKYPAWGHKEPSVFGIRRQIFLIFGSCFFCYCIQKAEDVGIENREHP